MLKKQPKKLLMPKSINPLKVNQSVMALILGMTSQAFGMWDCPRNTDRSYSISDVFKWRIEKLSERSTDKTELEKQKLELQNEKLTIEIEEMKSKNIPLETHRQILCSRASGLKSFWTETFMRNIHLFSHKSVEQLRPMVENFIRQALNTYAREHK